MLVVLVLVVILARNHRQNGINSRISGSCLCVYQMMTVIILIIITLIIITLIIITLIIITLIFFSGS